MNFIGNLFKGDNQKPQPQYGASTGETTPQQNQSQNQQQTLMNPNPNNAQIANRDVPEVQPAQTSKKASKLFKGMNTKSKQSQQQQGQQQETVKIQQSNQSSDKNFPVQQEQTQLPETETSYQPVYQEQQTQQVSIGPSEEISPQNIIQGQSKIQNEEPQSAMQKDILDNNYVNPLEANNEFQQNTDSGEKTKKKRPGGFGFVKKKQQLEEQSQQKQEQETDPQLSQSYGTYNQSNDYQQNVRDQQTYSAQEETSHIQIQNYSQYSAQKDSDEKQINEEKLQLPDEDSQHSTSIIKKKYTGSEINEQIEVPEVSQNQEEHSVSQQQQQQPKSTPLTGFLSKKKQQHQQSKRNSDQLDSSYKTDYFQLVSETECQEKQLNHKILINYTQQIELENEKASAQEQNMILSLELSGLSSEQQLCIEKEQFEKAEEIEFSIEEKNQKIIENQKKLEVIKIKLQRIEDEKYILSQERKPFYEKIMFRLESVQKSHQKYIDDFLEEQAALSKSVAAQIDEENERIKISQIHIDIDQKHLNQEETHLTELMNSQTKEQRDHQSGLKSKKEQLEKKITQLMNELQELQSELETVDENLEEVQQKIAHVHQKFNQQLQKVESKKIKLKEEKRMVELERNQIEKLEEKKREKENEIKAKQEGLDAQLRQMETQHKLMTERVTHLQLDYETEHDQYQQYQAAALKTYQVQCQLQETEKEVAELSFQRNLEQQQLNEMLEQKADYIKLIPKLKTEKKNLIDNKNFQGAKLITNQIKDTEAQIEQLDSKMVGSQEKEKEINNKLIQMDSIRQEKKQSFVKQKEISDLKRYDVLIIQKKELEKLKQSKLEQEDTKIVENYISQLEEQTQEIYNQYQDYFDKKEQKSALENQKQEIIQNQYPEHEDHNSQNENHNAQDEDNQEVIAQQGNDEQKEIINQTQSKEEQIQQVQEYIEKIEEFQGKVLQLEEEMQKQAEEDNFDEAEAIDSQSQQIRNQIDDIIKKLTQDYDIKNLEDAKEFVQSG